VIGAGFRLCVRGRCKEQPHAESETHERHPDLHHSVHGNLRFGACAAAPEHPCPKLVPAGGMSQHGNHARPCFLLRWNGSTPVFRMGTHPRKNRLRPMARVANLSFGTGKQMPFAVPFVV
jgi:hypothetical protein